MDAVFVMGFFVGLVALHGAPVVHLFTCLFVGSTVVLVGASVILSCAVIVGLAVDAALHVVRARGTLGAVYA